MFEKRAEGHGHGPGGALRATVTTALFTMSLYP